MSSTRDVHPAIAPYVVSAAPASATHASTAVLSPVGEDAAASAEDDDEHGASRRLAATAAAE